MADSEGWGKLLPPAGSFMESLLQAVEFLRASAELPARLSDNVGVPGAVGGNGQLSLWLWLASDGRATQSSSDL